MDKKNYTFVLSNVSGYIFDGLSPSTNYNFYAKAIDNKNNPSDEISIVVRTLDIPSPPVNGGGGSSGGGGSFSSSGVSKASAGQFSYCSIKWECSDWGLCVNSKQTRKCSYPQDKCKPEQEKPIETQSCVPFPNPENPSSTPTNSEIKNPPVDSNGSPKSNSPITGAAILGELGQFSWLLIIIALVIGGVAYYFLKIK